MRPGARSGELEGGADSGAARRLRHRVPEGALVELLAILNSE